MSFRRTSLIAGLAWIGLITGLHTLLNASPAVSKSAQSRGGTRFKVGFIPVTCHLTCPVTDFINKQIEGESFFEPVRFNGFPELKETFLAGDLPATFILAPLAMKLREDGVAIKIVYLGHRDGTAMMVRKDSDIRRIEDLKGRIIAVPNRYSNQRILIYKALRDRGITLDEVTLIEMPPPDMPAALYSRSVDAITSGEPYMAQTEMDGYGRVLYLTKDVWPNFISCVLAVREDVIRDDRAAVQRLVDGIARSGKWIDESTDHRVEAADIASRRQYYNLKNPELLRFVLTKPPDRVKYTNLTVRRRDFEEIEALGIESGVLQGTAHFEDYCDPSLVPEEGAIEPYDFEWKPRQ